jgi:hypothetical protein
MDGRSSYHHKHNTAHLYQIPQGFPLENGKGGERFEQSGMDIELDEPVFQ